MPLDVWYDKGLNFKCTGCGACCTGSPGYVWLTEEDISALTRHLNMTRADFLKKHCRQVHGRISLIEDPKTYDCTFLKDNKCSLYNARPRQCRTFPFWRDNLTSHRSWKEARAYCEGIDHPEGNLYTREEIDAHLD